MSGVSVIPYNTRMSKASDHEAECTEVLRRMVNSKPLSKAEISARIKAERAAKKAANDSPDNGQTARLIGDRITGR
jgi:hypothetical protein